MWFHGRWRSEDRECRVQSSGGCERWSMEEDEDNLHTRFTELASSPSCPFASVRRQACDPAPHTRMMQPGRHCVHECHLSGAIKSIVPIDPDNTTYNTKRSPSIVGLELPSGHVQGA